MLTAARIQTDDFGRTREGRPVTRFRLHGSGGLSVAVLDYGGIIQSLCTPDGTDVVLGHDQLAAYEADPFYLGALVGRVAGRIWHGVLPIDDEVHRLAVNNGMHHLHGGERGFGKVVWDATPLEQDDRVGVVLRHLSPDGYQGYPGTLRVEVTCAVSADNVLSLDYRATTDRATAVNLTQHSYFNLAGDGSGDVLGHELRVEAEAYTPLDPSLIPTGTIAPVEGTPFDFRTAYPLGLRMDDRDEQLRITGGYDQNFVLEGWDGTLRRAARLRDPASGRTLEVSTTQPGMQLYTGNFLDGATPGKQGHRYPRHAGVCLETQYFPDSPNQPAFPSIILRPGTELRARTEYRFSVQR